MKKIAAIFIIITVLFLANSVYAYKYVNSIINVKRGKPNYIMIISNGNNRIVKKPVNQIEKLFVYVVNSSFNGRYVSYSYKLADEANVDKAIYVVKKLFAKNGKVAIFEWFNRLHKIQPAYIDIKIDERGRSMDGVINIPPDAFCNFKKITYSGTNLIKNIKYNKKCASLEINVMGGIQIFTYRNRSIFIYGSNSLILNLFNSGLSSPILTNQTEVNNFIKRFKNSF